MKLIYKLGINKAIFSLISTSEYPFHEHYDFKSVLLHKLDIVFKGCITGVYLTMFYNY